MKDLKYTPQIMQDILKQVYQYKKEGDLEVLIEARESALTRFANNTIHQNIMQSNLTLSVRAQVGQKTGRANINTL
ncbi:hypothetical protein JW877_09340, partial [bacterium]|nr:hypothetical protein [bacterium]